MVYESTNAAKSNPNNICLAKKDGNDAKGGGQPVAVFHAPVIRHQNEQRGPHVSVIEECEEIEQWEVNDHQSSTRNFQRVLKNENDGNDS